MSTAQVAAAPFARAPAARPLWRTPLMPGLLGGAVGVYLATIGILQRFEDRNVITGVIGLGRTLLAILGLVVGFVAARRAQREGRQEAVARLAAGAVAGAITGAVLVALLIFVDAVSIRHIFVSLTPALVEMLSFERGTAVGGAILIAAGAVLGSVGAAVALLSARDRRPLLAGAVAVLLISLMEPLLRVVLFGIYIDPSWLYRLGGLTKLGAVVVFVIAFAVAATWTRSRESAKEAFGNLPREGRRAIKAGAFVALALTLLALPWIVGPFLSEVIGTVGLYVLLGLGLNIVVGYAGLLDLGYVAFFAVGAYATAVLTSPRSALEGPLNFWEALPIVVLVAVIAGVLIGAPVLRLRGDYLAIVTLGFGEIARVLVLSDWLEPFLGGAQGILSIPSPPPEALDLRDPERLYYLILLFSLLVAYVSWRLVDSRVGRAWAAMREDEQVAEGMGISIIKYKLLAFAMGAGLGCFSGAFFAIKIGSVFPHSFNILVSILVLAVIILGGMGSIPGVIVGAAVLVGLPELLREFAEYRLLIYGATLVAIMILRPEGLLPNVRRRRELREKESEEEQFEERAGVDTSAPVIVGGTERDVT